jgi:hypothetical protein
MLAAQLGLDLVERPPNLNGTERAESTAALSSESAMDTPPRAA